MKPKKSNKNMTQKMRKRKRTKKRKTALLYYRFIGRTQQMEQINLTYIKWSASISLHN